ALMAAKPAPSRPAPRLYLATPVVDDAAPLVGGLPGLLAGADVAAVLLRLKPSDPRGMIARIKALAPPVQDAGAALLIDGNVELVARAGADGAHLTGIEEAREFAAAGADFILVGELIWNDPRGAAAALTDAQQAIRDGHAMAGTSRPGMMPA